jgi:hypothetical protein
MSRHLHPPTNPYLLLSLAPVAATVGTLVRYLFMG